MIQHNTQYRSSFYKTFYSAARLKETLQTFQQLVRNAENTSQLKRMIQKQFEVYQVTGANGSSEMLVTGYYEPVLDHGSSSNIGQPLEPL